jgi:monomeric sarcosine oxidase
MGNRYSHIVIGAGALGSATAYWLARAGVTDVLVLEQFELGHGRGGSDDHSRMIRHSYHSEIYTRLTPAMFEAWREVEDEAGLPLVTTTGMLDLAVRGTPGESEMQGYASTLAPGVSSELLGGQEIRSRWPQWHVGDDIAALYQEDGGMVDIRRACGVLRALAAERGVQFQPRTEVLALEPAEGEVTVRTAGGEYQAGSVIVCTASWAPQLLRPLGFDWDITVSQEQVSYFATPHFREFLPDRFPVWAWHGDTLFYGMPVYGEVAVKVSRDVSGRWVTPQSRSFEPLAEETSMFAGFVHEYLPRAAGPELYSKTCIYDMPPDRDFILDVLPGQPRVIVGLGAGHAAKFTSLIGKILTELATEGTSKHPISAFSADRPALTDPSFTPVFRLQI